MRTFGFACLLTLWAAGAVHAAEVGVFPVVGTNLTEGEAEAIGQLVSSAYAVQSRRPTLGPLELGPLLEHTASERDSAREAGLQEYIHIEAVRLTTRIALYVRLHNQHGSTLFEVRETAYSLDDMPVVSERIAAALIRRTPLEYTRTIDNVTLRESRGKNRLFLEKIFGPRLGVVVPFAKHLENQASLLLQFDARLEQQNYFLEVAAGFWLPSQTNSREALSGFVAQLGGSYYLTHSSVSPYVGLGMSPRIFLGDYTGAGLAANAHIGVMLLRESSTRLYAELRVDQNLLKVRTANLGYYDNAGNYRESSGYNIFPTEFSFAAGVGF